MRFGFSDSWPVLEDRLDWVRWMGGDCVRFGVAAPPDVYNAGVAIGKCRAFKLRPFIVIGGWNPAPDPTVYAEWVRSYVAAFGSSVHYCLWNEPNYEHADHPNPLPAGEAAALNAAASKAAWDENSQVTVLGSCVGPTGDFQPYTRELYAAVPRVDVSINVYPGGKFEGRLEKVRQQLAWSKTLGPLHVTEIDMAAPWMGDDTKPKLAAKSYGLLERQGVRTAIYHGIEAHLAEAEELRKARLG